MIQLRVFISLNLLLCLCGTARANVCVSRSIHVRSVHGLVTDQLGEQIPGAKVLIKRGDETVMESVTDQRGIFRMTPPAGAYDLIVQSRGFVNGWVPLKVGFGPKSLFHSNALYLVLAIGSPECAPNATTSKREYQSQIRAYKAESKEREQEDATQK